MFLRFLQLFVTFVFILCAFIAWQPSHFELVCEKEMQAPIEKVFSKINTLKEWETWSPWRDLDSKMLVTYEGPQEGVGAISRWNGHKAGKGSQTIVQSIPNEKIVMELEFLKPLKATQTSEFLFQGTKVTWRTFGKRSFVGKALCLFFRCDAKMKEAFEKGLASVDAVSL